MKLTKVQNRFIKNKNMGFSLMKGKSLTGKTITALHRVINLVKMIKYYFYLQILMN